MNLDKLIEKYEKELIIRKERRDNAGHEELNAYYTGQVNIITVLIEDLKSLKEDTL